MMPIVAIFVWALAASSLVQSPRRWVRGVGGGVTIVGALVCANVLFHFV